ncbi:MAG TPA: hypothetical protein PKO09_00965 [Anaerolineae bacterium]|nr:hypothetical protein [Anaerolineae bacterium]
MSEMLQIPALLVLLLVASLVAVLLHLWMGRNVRDFLLFWLASLAGCVGGQLLGQELGLIPLTVGQVHVAEAAIGSALAVLLAAWLRPQGKQPGAPKQ